MALRRPDILRGVQKYVRSRARPRRDGRPDRSLDPGRKPDPDPGRRNDRRRRSRRPPEAPKILAARDIDRLFGAVLAAEPTPPARFLLYFETGSAVLVPESEALIPEILAAVRARKSVDIGVVGHTDSVGNPEVNDRLALSRAQRVKDILLAAAVPSEAIEISSHGKNNPLVPTPDETPEPRNRRVEVIVR